MMSKMQKHKANDQFREDLITDLGAMNSQITNLHPSPRKAIIVQTLSHFMGIKDYFSRFLPESPVTSKNYGDIFQEPQDLEDEISLKTIPQAKSQISQIDLEDKKTKKNQMDTSLLDGVQQSMSSVHSRSILKQKLAKSLKHSQRIPYKKVRFSNSTSPKPKIEQVKVEKGGLKADFKITN